MFSVYLYNETTGNRIFLGSFETQEKAEALIEAQPKDDAFQYYIREEHQWQT